MSDYISGGNRRNKSKDKKKEKKKHPYKKGGRFRAMDVKMRKKDVK